MLPKCYPLFLALFSEGIKAQIKGGFSEMFQGYN